jgi:hypothetical protein
MCLRRAPEKYIAGAALDRAGITVQVIKLVLQPELLLIVLNMLYQERYMYCTYITIDMSCNNI